MRVVALDMETALTTGEPSVQFYRDDFRAISCAFAWRDGGEVRERCCFGEAAIERDLGRLTGALFLVYNAQFDTAVYTHRFPNLPPPQWVDVMRLVQNADNGGATGFSLQAAVKRWLPIEYHDHKEPYYALIRERGGKRGKEGANLHLLTREELGRYNSRDAVVTLALYERLEQYFKDINHDWTIDHDLYKANVPFLVKAEARGVLVDRHQAREAVTLFSGEVLRLERGFMERFRCELDRVEAGLRERALSKYRTEKGRANASLDHCVFNIGSTLHLKLLFCGELGMSAKFSTEKGAPAFGKAFLSQWGEGGKMLERRRGLIIGMQQAQALLEESVLDGRYHIRLKAVGTKTGRKAGGSHG